MKLIRKLIEDAAGGAVGGGDVAAAATPLFAQLSKRDLPIKVRITKKKKEKKEKHGLGIRENFYSRLDEIETPMAPQEQTFDTTEVIAKLKSLENKEIGNKYDTQAFALEDDKGNLVKVRVRSDQAANFEASLNAFLADRDEDETHGTPEIAEILYKLKDRFDIVDVEWPEVAEDEEQEVELAGGEAGAEGQGEMGAEGGLDAASAELGDVGGGEDEAKSLLVQVIDMMKADAEARKAEAHARAAEAKAKEASLATAQVYAKVKQEEQILDMEAYNRQKKEEEKEAKRLAQLAKWKHDMEREEGASFDNTEVDTSAVLSKSEEQEEVARKGSGIRGRVEPSAVADYILKRVK